MRIAATSRMIASDIGLDDLSLGYNAPMDSYGHILGRVVTGGGGELPSSLALVVSRATNRLGGAGYYHDVLGNLVTMPAADGVGTVSMTYLDQGHIGTLTDAAGVVWKYYYDADGKRRIKAKTAGGAATEPDGQGGVRLVADRSYYFYEGENLICQQDIGALVQDESQYEPKFLLLDHLGSTRAELVFDPVSLAPQIQEFYDLMPYGEVIDPPTMQENVLFTGKSRDIESGLDNLGARSYSSAFCRFPSVDPLTGSARNPQSWNRYSYAVNNPLRFIDPTGMAPADYWDERGRHLGSDGQNDQRNLIVTNEVEATQIKNADRRGQPTPTTNITSAVEMPSAAVRQAIGAAVQRSNSPATTCQQIGENPQPDARGGRHEEGGLWGSINGVETVAPAVPGPAGSTSADSVSMVTGDSVNPNVSAQQMQSVDGQYHVHPAGVDKGRGFVQGPSSQDYRLGVFRTNIVVGARDRTVYFYNTTTTIATFPLNRFLALP